MTLFMLVPAMRIKLVVAIEPLSTEPAFWMPFETALVYGARMVVSELFMFLQILLREQLVLMCKNLFIPCAQIAQYLVVDISDVTVKIWPPLAGNVATFVRAIVPK